VNYLYNGNKIAAFIPARGGSKGVKRKNIRLLAGKPLIYYTIQAALESNYIDKVIVSTEDKEIAEISKSFGAEVPFLRPQGLAEDTTTTIDVVLHGIKVFFSQEKWDSMVLLQPTQPLRTSEDIDNALVFYYEHSKRSLVSVSEVGDHPILMRRFDKDRKLQKLFDLPSSVRRQDMEQIYRVNGAIYINQMESLTRETSFNDNELGFIMDKSHSVDIDELPDFALAEYYLSGKII
jgi:CMP-N,N'-diacetyllegionaminic acid synthase